MPLRVVSAVDSVVSVVSFVVAAVVVTVVSDSSVALSHAHKSMLPVHNAAKSSEVIFLVFFFIEFSPFIKQTLFHDAGENTDIKNILSPGSFP
jgi:hypothetical protein